MDIRIEKTKTAIHNTFLELRSKKPLEKITIKELCELTKISTSTAYRLIRNGTLPATKLVGTRHWKIPYNALPNYVSGSIIAKF